MRTSRGLKWENKMYKLKRSIVRVFNDHIGMVDADSPTTAIGIEEYEKVTFNKENKTIVQISRCAMTKKGYQMLPNTRN